VAQYEQFGVLGRGGAGEQHQPASEPDEDQIDLVTGEEYAYPTFDPYDGPPAAARVRVVSMDGGGKATVAVLDPGPTARGALEKAGRLRRGEKKQVATREIACRWADWAERVAASVAEKETRAAERRQWHDDNDRRRADRTRVDPGRPLPDTYDPDADLWYGDDEEERAELAKAYLEGRSFGARVTPDSVAALLRDLPLFVARDIVAATRFEDSPAAGTVAAVFARAAGLFKRVRLDARGDRTPWLILQGRDAAYIAAACEQVAASDGQVVLPFVPLLPGWLDRDVRAMGRAFGWLRVAVGDTSGTRIHDPGCRAITAQSLKDSGHVRTA